MAAFLQKGDSMQFKQKTKRIFGVLLSSALCCGMLCAVGASAQAAEILPQEVYMEEVTPHTCTLTSATMLLRSTLYLNGSSHWNEVTDEEVRSVAWLPGAGLLYGWTYETDYAAITVQNTELDGITPEALKALLDAHPEGIVFYCIASPHAVFLTDYEGDTFYCADPANYIAGSRIPLAESWLGECFDSDQDTILANASAYWAVTDCSVVSDVEVTPLAALQAAETDQTETADETAPEETPQPTLSVRRQLVAEAEDLLERLQSVVL